jgi:hypothetical protein
MTTMAQRILPLPDFLAQVTVSALISGCNGKGKRKPYKLHVCL